MTPIGVDAMHSLYADDVTLIFRAVFIGIQHIMQILDAFGRASGLYVSGEKMKTAFIPEK